MAFLNETGLEQVWGKIKTKVSSIENTISDINKAKVDKISGKGLSTNDFTTDEKNKLAGIATGATKVIVDSALNSTSTNAIQNKVVTNMKTNIDDELSNKPSKTGDGASGTWGINVTGSATKLTTARSINGTSFDGTGNITTSCWGTARNIYIIDSNNNSANKSSAVSVNGNADITLKMPATFKMTKTQSITVAGDANTYYPVVISMSNGKDRPMEISIHKDLGSTTPSSYEHNHENGTSSLWLLYEGRNNYWDGNGGYIKTLYKYQGYATLVSHAEQASGSSGDLRVWLRGGGCYYEISTTTNATVNIYYSKTNLGTSSYPDEVTPRTTIGNGGIVTNALLGYGNIQGNATTATTATTCTGNAATATKATQDGSGNVISSTYLKRSGGTINGVFGVRHSTNHPYLMLESSSYNDYQSQIYYSIPSSSATANFGFREYSRSSSDYTLLSYYEEFELPSVISDRTYNSTYRILTTKSTVTVAQGGTGATSKSGARTNLGITSGTSLPSASGYSAGDIFILY